MRKPATLQDAIAYFANYDTCHRFMAGLRWPDGVVKCPVCASPKLTYLSGNRVWKCYAPHAKPRFSLKSGTIFEDSPIALEKWLPAVWIFLNDRKSSSSDLQRAIGVTQKTGWFMLHRLRLAAHGKTFQAGAEFENFKHGMKLLLSVKKSRLDRMVEDARANSPRLGDPHAPGRKRNPGPSTILKTH